MASLDNTKAGPGELISFEDVHRALARQRKRAESDLAADPVSASPRPQNSPVNTPDVNPVKRANIAPQEPKVTNSQNTAFVPKAAAEGLNYPKSDENRVASSDTNT
jgi:hypothetical protein